MRKFKQLILKVKRLFKSPSQFLIGLEKGQYNKAYTFYFNSILEKVDSKHNRKRNDADKNRKHEKIRERMLELANVNKTKYNQNEHTKRFFEILEKSEAVNIPKSKNIFLNDLVNKLKNRDEVFNENMEGKE